MNKGKLIQIIGSVFDAKFEEGQIPSVFNAIEIPGEFSGGKKKLYGEVQQHLGGGRVRSGSGKYRERQCDKRSDAGRRNQSSGADFYQRRGAGDREY